MKSLLGLISDFFLLIASEKKDVLSVNILQREIDPSSKPFICIIGTIMVSKQIPVEHLLKSFSMKTFFHLKGSVPVDLGDKTGSQ